MSLAEAYMWVAQHRGVLFFFVPFCFKYSFFFFVFMGEGRVRLSLDTVLDG